MDLLKAAITPSPEQETGAQPDPDPDLAKEDAEERNTRRDGHSNVFVYMRDLESNKRRVFPRDSRDYQYYGREAQDPLAPRKFPHFAPGQYSVTRIFEIVTSMASNSQFAGSALSDRDIIYASGLEAISLQPVIGYGPFWSARLVIPAHNIFLGLLMQYGVVLGSVLISSITFLFYNGFRDHNLRIFYIILTPSFTYLMFSGNYLMNFEFWIFLTIVLSTVRFRAYHA